MKIKLNHNLIIGGALILSVFVLAFLGLVYTPYPPNEMHLEWKLQAPDGSHLFGTDQFGRDIFSRVAEGTSVSFFIAFCVVLAGGTIGTVIGALTGYFGGWFDSVLMRCNDVLAAFPSVLLALCLVAVIGPGKWNLIVALGIVFIPSFTRVVRSEVLVQRELDYVKNARIMGASHARILFFYILPNIRPVLVTSFLVGFQNAVLSEAGMSYLGLGVTQPDPSLGRMLSEAQGYLWNAPWYAMAPGITILMFTLGLGLLSGHKE